MTDSAHVNRQCDIQGQTMTNSYPQIIYFIFVDTSICSVPGEAPENGSVVLQGHGNGTIPAGSKAEYTCNDGYTLIGPSVKVCTERGNWEPYHRVFCAHTEVGELKT